MVKTEKISNRTLVGVVAVSVIVFLIYTFGGSEPYAANPEFDEPNFTELFIYLMYALIVGTLGACIWSFVRGLSLGNTGGTENRVPGGKVALITWGSFAASIVIGLVLGLGATDFRAADGTVTEAGWVTIVDMFMISMYILAAVLIVLVIASMAGVIASTNKVK
ncbi:MAG: hypothetical protein HUK00_07530 [Bacteroidaceae bacterium]|nr:hypothetical protein [Bacteroidaceae bacterium]